MQMVDIYEYFHLHVSGDQFIVQPCRLSDLMPVGNEALVIDRTSRDISVRENPFIAPDASVKPIFGIFGIINLLSGPHLIVITKRESVGTLNQRQIYRVTQTEILPFAKTTLHLSEAQIQDNRVLVSMVESVLAIKSYYFATDFDLTHSLQRLSNTSPDFLQMPLHERADQRFVWNHYMLRDLTLIREAYRFALPVMLGFVCIRECQVAGQNFKLTLISRRSCYRAGVRFQMRGIDAEGHTANFVETEQILECGEHMCSYVQTRGSIPVYWSQKPNLRWQPFPLIKSDDHLSGFRRHIQAQQFLYGRQILLNLVNHKGRELTMGSILETVVRNSGMEDVKLVAFDFHKEGFRRLPFFVDESLMPDILNIGYYAARRTGHDVAKQQSGVFRTNCMDCLDRTNVLQSLLAKLTLQHQLQWLNVLSDNDNLERYPEFQYTYKHLWADNGDSCSVQYAGTGALKADFTRTGMRTYRGCYNDLVNALHRWYINNFTDGYRQDAIDLCLGNVALDDQMRKTLFKQEWDWRFLLFAALCVALSMCILSFIFSTEHAFGFVVFWLIVFVTLLATVIYYGEEFVNKAVLRFD